MKDSSSAFSSKDTTTQLDGRRPAQCKYDRTSATTGMSMRSGQCLEPSRSLLSCPCLDANGPAGMITSSTENGRDWKRHPCPPPDKKQVWNTRVSWGNQVGFLAPPLQQQTRTKLPAIATCFGFPCPKCPFLGC
jgi:hypothetical protein